MPGLYFDSGISKGFDQDLARMRGNLNVFSSQVTKENAMMSSSFNSMAKSIAGVVSVMAIGAAGKELINFSKNLETALTEVSTVSKEVTDNFDQYKNTLLAMSTESATGAVQLTNAFYDIVSAGYDGARGLEVLKASQDASVAGFVEVGVAADGLTTVLNAWGLKAEETGRISDIFFKSVELGKTTFPELASNISQVAPIAASMGVSFEEMAAAVATLTKSGTPTAQALTQIRASLIASNEVLGDGWAKTMTYQEAMVLLQEKAGGSTTELTKMVGRVEAVNAVLALTGKNAEGAAKDLDAMSTSLGATALAAEKVTQSTAEQIGILKNNILAALEPLGNSAKTLIGNLAVSLNKAFDSGKVQEYAKILLQLAKAFITYKVAVIAINQLQKQKILLMERAAVQTKLAAMQGIQLSKAEALAAAGSVSLSRGLKAIGAAFAANPIGLIVTALTMAVPALIDMFKALESSEKKMKSINEEIGKTIAEETTGLKILKNQLNDNNLSVDKKKELIAQLNEEYGKYLPNLLTEKSSQEEINKAIEIANTNLSEQIRLRVLNQKAQEAAAKIYELERKVEKRKGQVVLNTALELTGRGLGAARINLPLKALEEEKQLYEELLNEILESTVKNSKDISEVSTTSPSTTGATKELSAEDKEKIRQNAIKALEIENQTRINGLTAQYAGEDNLEKEFNKKLLENRLVYLLKYRKLTTDQLEKLRIDEEALKLTAELANDADAEMLQANLSKYKTYSQERKEIEDEYQASITQLRKNGYEEQAAEAEAAMNLELKRLDEALVNSDAKFQDWLKVTLPGIAKQGLSALSEQLSGLKVQLQTENLSPKDVVLVTEKIKELESAIASKNEKEVESVDNWNELLDLLNNVNGFIDTVVESFGDVNSNTKIMLEGIGDTVGGLIGMASAVKLLKTSLSGLEKASVILTLIGTALQIVNGIRNAIEKSRKQREERAVLELETIQAMNMALIEQNALYDEGNSFFSDDKWGSALVSLESYNVALKAQNELLQDIVKSSKIYTKLQVTPQADYRNAFQGISVKTKDRGKIGEFFKGGDDYDSLLNVYPALITATGELDTNMLKLALDSADLSKTDKTRLENLLELTESAQDSIAKFGDYISSIFGGVGDEITQAFQTMYESGTDAMTGLEGTFSDMIESFTRDAIEFALLQPLMDELNTTTKTLGEQYAKGDLNASELQKGIVDSIGGFYKGLNEIQPQILQAYQTADQLAQEAGFSSAFNNDAEAVGESGAVSKAGQVSQAITEETGSMLIGRMGAIMMSNERIANYSADALDYAVQNLVTLNKIKENTDYLPIIADNTRKTYEKLENV